MANSQLRSGACERQILADTAVGVPGQRGFIHLLESCPLQGGRVGLRINATTTVRGDVLQIGRRAPHQGDHAPGYLVEFVKGQHAALALIPADVRKKCGFVGVPELRAGHVAVVIRPYVSLNTMLGTPCFEIVLDLR